MAQKSGPESYDRSSWTPASSPSSFCRAYPEKQLSAEGHFLRGYYRYVDSGVFHSSLPAPEWQGGAY